MKSGDGNKQCLIIGAQTENKRGSSNTAFIKLKFVMMFS